MVVAVVAVVVAVDAVVDGVVGAVAAAGPHVRVVVVRSWPLQDERCCGLNYSSRERAVLSGGRFPFGNDIIIFSFLQSM